MLGSGETYKVSKLKGWVAKRAEEHAKEIGRLLSNYCNLELIALDEEGNYHNFTFFDLIDFLLEGGFISGLFLRDKQK
jgi:hypothetical protein